jgi:hypothetical protein
VIDWRAVADVADRLELLAATSPDPFARGYAAALVSALDSMSADRVQRGYEGQAVVALARRAAVGRLPVRRSLVARGCRPRGDGAAGLRRVVACADAPAAAQAVNVT